MLGRTLTGLGALAVLGIGAAALTWPREATATYGIPTEDADTLAYVRASAARDLVMGAFVLWAVIANDRKAMEVGLATSVIAPAADFVLVRARRGDIPQLLIHGAGIAGVSATWALLRAGW